MVYRAGQLLEQVEARSFPFVIGRSNANELVIIDKEVSRRHALIDCIGGIYVVEDLNSKNGIRVNQKRRARALLRSGDIISFGQVDVVFYLERKRAGKTITDPPWKTSRMQRPLTTLPSQALLRSRRRGCGAGYPAASLVCPEKDGADTGTEGCECRPSRPQIDVLLPRPGWRSVRRLDLTCGNRRGHLARSA